MTCVPMASGVRAFPCGWTRMTRAMWLPSSKVGGFFAVRSATWRSEGLSKRELRLVSMAVRARRPDAQKRRSVRLEEMLKMLRELRKTEAGLREAMRREEPGQGA